MKGKRSQVVQVALLLAVCCVLACVPSPRVRVTYEDADAETISRLGPIMPAVMAAGQFAATAFFEANWPLVVDYQLETEAVAQQARGNPRLYAADVGGALLIQLGVLSWVAGLFVPKTSEAKEPVTALGD